MANESPDGGVKPWTVRNVPPESHNAAIEAAKRADLGLGESLSQANRTTNIEICLKEC